MKTLITLLLIVTFITINAQEAKLTTNKLYYKDVVYNVERTDNIIHESVMVQCIYNNSRYLFIIKNKKVITYYSFKDERWYNQN